MTKYTWNNRTVAWIDDRMPVISLMREHLVDYPAPKNLNYFWNFGSLAGIMLIVMIATGIFLAMHYTPTAELAFDSIERIMRDVNYGWLLRYLHMNGASMFFIVVYIHMFRGLYYGSYKQPRELLWILGVVIILLMMATAFMGYVLPWGQMSFWAAQVITGFATAIPIFGEDIKVWLWGGPALGTPLLGRFFVLHFLMPFVIFAIVFLHLWALHEKKSNNPLGVDIKGPQDTIPFHPYYTIKDAFGLGVFLIFYLGIVFFWPDIFGEPINYIKADPLNTPHIVPEWYFLPFYAILRAVTFDILFIPAKLIGVVLMVGAIAILFFLPWLDRSPVRSAKFRPLYRIFFWIFVVNCFLLGTVGAQAPEGIWVILGQLATLYYFAHFLVILPLLGYVERPLAVPTSISEPVTAQGQGSTVAVGGAAE